MSFLDDIKRQKRIRAAEGYLELLMVLGERWQLRPENRKRVARRALAQLTSVECYGIDISHLHYLRGQAFRAMENFRDAIEPLQLALKSDPQNTHIHLALAWCFKRIDRLDLAIQSLEEAMEISPDEGIVHYNLACYWALANNPRQAVKYLHQSFDIDPNYREMVAGEVDFDSIRGDAGFQSLVSVNV